MKEKLKQYGWQLWKGWFVAMFFLLPFAFTLVFACSSYALVGGDGSPLPDEPCGGAPCYSGVVWVNYKYKTSSARDVYVGGDWLYEWQNMSEIQKDVRTKIPAKCYSFGGFWHLEHRTSALPDYNAGGVARSINLAFGNAPATAVDDIGLGNVSAVASSWHHTEAFGSYDLEDIRFDNGNYNSSEVEVVKTTDDNDYVMSIYADLYEKNGSSFSNMDAEEFMNSSNSWFCGEASPPPPPPSDSIVKVKTNTNIRLINASSDYTGSGTQDDPYVAKSDSTTTAYFYSNHKITRTDSESSPEKAPIKWQWRDNVSNTAWSGDLTANLKAGENSGTISVGGSSSYSINKTISTALTSTPKRVCAYTRAWGKKYTGNTLTKDKYGKKSSTKCIYVQAAKTETVPFTGSVSIRSTDSKLTSEGGDYYKGDGVSETFEVAAKYTIRRGAEPTSPSGACSSYATRLYVSNGVTTGHSTWGTRAAPTARTSGTDTCSSDSNKLNKSLSAGGSVSVDGKEKTITVPIGTTRANAIEVCYYLSYDNSVRFTNGSATSRAFDGRSSTCIHLYNTPDNATAAFSGRTRGSLSPDPNSTKLEDLSGGARTKMRLIYEQTGGTFTAVFSHYMTWTNSGVKSWLTSVQSRWRIQESYDDGNSWSNRSENGTQTFVNGTEVNISNSTQGLILNSSNLGKYIVYCQRLHYDGSANYQSAAGGGATRVSWGSKLNSTKACVTLLNPRWEDTEKNEHITTINVDGQTTGDSMSDGAVNVGGSSYQMKKLTATALFDHSLRRWFDGWDETGVSGGMSKLCNASGGACGSTTMFSSAYNVTTRFSGVGTGLADSSLAPIGASSGRDYLPLTFVSNGKNHSDVLNWYSDATKGRTETLLGATKPKAGQSGDLCHAEHNEPAKWEVKYKEVWQVESYDSDLFGSGGILAGRTPEEHYKHTRLKSSSPEVVSGSRFTANPARCVSVERKWNYMTTSIKPGDRDGDDVVVAGDLIKRSFEVTIERDTGWDDVDRDTFGFEINREYITSISQEKTSAKLVTFVINPRPESTDKDSYLHTIEDGVMGDSNYGSSDYCRFFKDKLGGLFDDGNCQVINDVELTADPSNNMGFGDTASSLTSYSPTIEKDGISVPNLAVGAKFCVAAVIDDKSSTSTNAFISAADCQNVSKKPSVHVWGGSVQSEGGISTNKSTVEEDGRKTVYGSWADIGVIARGKINAMSSGRALVYRKSLDGGSFVNKLFKYVGNETGSISPLTLANSSLESDKYLGGYTTLTNQPDLYSAINGKYSLDSGTNSAVTVDADGVLTQDEINTLLLTPGAHIVYGGSGKDMVIERNVVLSDSYSNASGIPYIMVVADGDILVSEAVTRVDAWLVARGNVETCAKLVGSEWKAYIDNLGEGVSDGDGLLLSAWTCKEQLVINGPVYGNAINLKRTAFADNKEGNIAEEAERTSFDITSLLFSASQADGGVPNITYIKKMAPRY